MVKIRLRRMGNRNRAFFRIVVANSTSPANGRFIETIGWYDPLKEGENHQINMERLDYWTSKGAQMNTSVKSLVNRLKNPDAARARDEKKAAVKQAAAEAAEAARQAEAAAAAAEASAE